MALVTAALLPLGALSLGSAFSASQTALDQARDQLTLAASLVAAQQDRRADAAEHLLAVITAVPEIRSLDRERCQAYMESLRGRYPIYGNIGILDLKGDLLCHAADRLGRFNAADRLYFREAVANRLAAGELDARVEAGIAGQGDEFGHIASTLNAMAQQLQARQRELVAELDKTREAHAMLDEANRTLELRVEQATQGLRQSNRELEAFSYSVSHDLRAPLAAVSGFARALEDRLLPHDDPKVPHYLARIRAGAQQMEELIQGLLQLARLVREPMACAPVDLSAMAHETLEWLRLQAPERVVDVWVQPGMQVQGDARMLRTVMQNLLGNAWKFTSQCGAPVHAVPAAARGHRLPGHGHRPGHRAAGGRAARRPDLGACGTRPGVHGVLHAAGRTAGRLNAAAPAPVLTLT